MGKNFDVIVIGGGPGGYIAAIRAAQLGFNVACIDEWKNAKGGPAPGGTCTNVGCIPSKALLQSSEHFEHAGHHFADHGIGLKDLSIDVPKMLARKDQVVKQNNDGILYLFKKNKVSFFHGRGSFVRAVEGGWEVAVAGAAQELLVGRQVVVATGSNARALPGVPFDEERILSNDGALRVGAVPKTLGLIGSGVIGLEMGSVWQRLGAKVTVVEFLDRIMPGMDNEVSKQMQRILQKQGMAFKLSTKVTGAKVTAKGVTLTVEPAAGGAAETIETDIVLVAIGRRPYTDGLGLKEAGVALDDKGRVAVDAHFQTNVKGIYAIGDAIQGPMLAHKAEDEGMAVAEILVGQHGHVNYDAVPSVVYTWPEVASVGKTEEQLKADGVAFKIGKFPFTANGRARAQNNTDGFVKILADAKTDRVLGVHMIGPSVGELVGEMALAIEFGASSEDIARTCHAHPTLTEAVREAALAVDGRPIHI
jgi:dihydrolipoamide dehydrogenase